MAAPTSRTPVPPRAAPARGMPGDTLRLRRRLSQRILRRRRLLQHRLHRARAWPATSRGRPGSARSFPPAARRTRRTNVPRRTSPPAASTAPATAAAAAATTSRVRCARRARARSARSSASTSATGRADARPGRRRSARRSTAITTTNACVATCRSSADCVTGVACVNGSCGPKPPGAVCAKNATARPGSAPTASAATSPAAALRQLQPGRAGGTCWPVDAGTSDPHAICKDKGPASCGQTGACDGVGGCALYAAETICVAPSCSGGDRLNTAGTCNGLGACRAPGVQVCAPLPLPRRRLHLPLHQRRRLPAATCLRRERQLRPQAERPAVRRRERLQQQLLRRWGLLRRRVRRRLPQLRAAVLDGALHARARGRRRSAQRVRRPGRAELRARRQMRRRRRLPLVRPGDDLRRRALRQQRLHAALDLQHDRPVRRARRPRLRPVRVQRRPLLHGVHDRRAVPAGQGCTDNSCGLKLNGAFCADKRECAVGQLRPGRLLRHGLRQRVQVVRAAGVDGHLHATCPTASPIRPAPAWTAAPPAAAATASARRAPARATRRERRARTRPAPRTRPP